MAKSKLVQIELSTGNTRIVVGSIIDPERAFLPGSLGVDVFEATDSRGKRLSTYNETFIPWSQIRMVHRAL